MRTDFKVKAKSITRLEFVAENGIHEFYWTIERDMQCGWVLHNGGTYKVYLTNHVEMMNVGLALTEAAAMVEETETVDAMDELEKASVPADDSSDPGDYPIS